MPKIPGSKQHRGATWITLLNHKGGVGKTMLAVNLAGALSDQGYRVLLVDADPQCNLSALLIEISHLDRLLDTSETTNGETIWTALKPVVDAAGEVRSIARNKTSILNVDLLVGDVRLSEFERLLGGFWLDALALRPRGYRGISAVAQAVRFVKSPVEYDYIICDTGPNMGDLNRSILMATDCFIVPVFPDMFSIRALKTLGVTIHEWASQWPRISEMAPAEIDLLMKGAPKFLGYVLQRAKIGPSITRDQSAIKAQLERHVYEDLVQVLDARMVDKRRKSFRLGTIPDVTSGALQSQLYGVPVWDLKMPEVNPSLARAAREACLKIAESVTEFDRK